MNSLDSSGKQLAFTGSGYRSVFFVAARWNEMNLQLKKVKFRKQTLPPQSVRTTQTSMKLQLLMIHLLLGTLNVGQHTLASVPRLFHAQILSLAALAAVVAAEIKSGCGKPEVQARAALWCLCH